MEVVAGIAKLPEDWHGAGTVQLPVLETMVRITQSLNVVHSAETGSGKTTLLFSHLSENHSVFAVDAGNSMTAVKQSAIFRPDGVEFIEGPTQQTLPRYNFTKKYQVVMIDGPHGYPFPDIEYWHFYPHIETNGILILDDIHIPTIWNIFNFLKEEAMFELIEVVDTTAFFRRTAAPTFDPYCDGWWEQKYNMARFPVPLTQPEPVTTPVPRAVYAVAQSRQSPNGLVGLIKSLVPLPIKKGLKKMLGLYTL